MANAFDKFDDASGGNPFDQFESQGGGFFDRLSGQVSEGFQNIKGSIGNFEGTTFGVPTQFAKGVAQIATAPISAASGAITAPLENIKPPGSNITIKQARQQGQLLPLESPQEALETAIGMTMPGKPKMIKGAVEIPTQEELLGVYRPLEASGELKMRVMPDAINELREQIRDDLWDHNFRPNLQGDTFKALEELQPEITMSRRGKEVKKPATIMDIESVRRVLNNITDPKERAAARHARNLIDDYLSEVPNEHIEGGASVGDLLKEVRKNYSQGKKAARISEALELGEGAAQRSGSGANLDNALRQQIDKIIRSPKESRFFTKEELEVLKEARKGGSIANAARLLSKFGPKHPITGWGTALAADFGGGMGSASATLAAGHLAQLISEGARVRDIKRIEELLRKASPMYEQRLSGAAMVPSYPGGPQTFGAGAAALATEDVQRYLDQGK